MIKVMSGAMLLMACLAFAQAEQKPVLAEKPGSTARSAAVRKMMSGVSEIGAILEDQHVVFENTTLASNVLNAVIAAIDPAGGAILTKDQARQRLDEQNGVFYGIGCKFRIKEKWPQIIEVVSNGPAAKIGLCASNLIIKIENQSTEGMSLESVARLLRGAKDQALELTIQIGEKNTATRVLKMQRSAIQTPVTGTTETWPQNIGYLKVNGLYTNSGAIIVEQLDAWRGTNCFGIILDIRGADGMDLESAVKIGSLFAQAGETLFILRDGHDTATAAYQAKTAQSVDKPVMVLIDQDTSGAAEVLAGLLSVCKGAMLIGTPTRGDDRIRNSIPLANGGVLYIAMQKIVLEKGPAYYQKGVIPHVRITATNTPAMRENEVVDEEPDIFAGISEQERQDRALIKRIGDDAILRRATDILLGLKALDFKVH